MFERLPPRLFWLIATPRGTVVLAIALLAIIALARLVGGKPIWGGALPPTALGVGIFLVFVIAEEWWAARKRNR